MNNIENLNDLDDENLNETLNQEENNQIETKEDNSNDFINNNNNNNESSKKSSGKHSNEFNHDFLNSDKKDHKENNNKDKKISNSSNKGNDKDNKNLNTMNDIDNMDNTMVYDTNLNNNSNNSNKGKTNKRNNNFERKNSIKDNKALKVINSIFSNILATLLFITITLTIMLTVFENVILKDEYVKEEIVSMQEKYSKPIEELSKISEEAKNSKDEIQKQTNVEIPTKANGNIDTDELLKKYGKNIDKNTINSEETKVKIEQELEKKNLHVSKKTIDKVTKSLSTGDEEEIKDMSKKAKMLKEFLDINNLCKEALKMLVILDAMLVIFIVLFNVLYLHKSLRYFGRALIGAGIINALPKLGVVLLNDYIKDGLGEDDMHLYNLMHISSNYLLYAGIGTFILGIGLIIVYKFMKK